MHIHDSRSISLLIIDIIMFLINLLLCLDFIWYFNVYWI